MVAKLFLLKMKWVAFRVADLFWSMSLEVCLKWKEQMLVFTKNSGICNAETRLNETVDLQILQFAAY